MVPEVDLDAAYAAGPVARGYGYVDDTTIGDVLDGALALKRPKFVRVTRPEGALTLRRG